MLSWGTVFCLDDGNPSVKLTGSIRGAGAGHHSISLASFRRWVTPLSAGRSSILLFKLIGIISFAASMILFPSSTPLGLLDF